MHFAFVQQAQECIQINKAMVFGIRTQACQYFSPASCNLQKIPPSHYDKFVRTNNCIIIKGNTKNIFSIIILKLKHGRCLRVRIMTDKVSDWRNGDRDVGLGTWNIKQLMDRNCAFFLCLEWHLNTKILKSGLVDNDYRTDTVVYGIG